MNELINEFRYLLLLPLRNVNVFIQKGINHILYSKVNLALCVCVCVWICICVFNQYKCVFLCLNGCVLALQTTSHVRWCAFQVYAFILCWHYVCVCYVCVCASRCIARCVFISIRLIQSHLFNSSPMNRLQYRNRDNLITLRPTDLHYTHSHCLLSCENLQHSFS